MKESMTAIPRLDFHIHTKCLGCANETMEVPAIAQECERLGLEALGITDHVNSLDRLPLHLNIKRDLEVLETQIPVYFGVELNFTGLDEGFPFSAELKEEYGIQFAIGGIHNAYLESYDLETLLEIQHRHHLKTCRDPLVDVLVHPYWFWKGEFDSHNWPWFDSVAVVPESHVRELGQVARETGTAIEMNATASLAKEAFGEDYVKEYVEFLSIIAEEGASFSLGSDSHDIGSLREIRNAWQVAEQLNLTEDRIWRPQGAPFVGGEIGRETRQ